MGRLSRYRKERPTRVLDDAQVYASSGPAVSSQNANQSKNLSKHRGATPKNILEKHERMFSSAGEFLGNTQRRANPHTGKAHRAARSQSAHLQANRAQLALSIEDEVKRGTFSTQSENRNKKKKLDGGQQQQKSNSRKRDLVAERELTGATRRLLAVQAHVARRNQSSGQSRKGNIRQQQQQQQQQLQPKKLQQKVVKQRMGLAVGKGAGGIQTDSLAERKSVKKEADDSKILGDSTNDVSSRAISSPHSDSEGDSAEGIAEARSASDLEAISDNEASRELDEAPPPKKTEIGPGSSRQQSKQRAEGRTAAAVRPHMSASEAAAAGADTTAVEAAMRSAKPLAGENFYEFSKRLSRETREALVSKSMNKQEATKRSAKSKDFFSKRAEARETKKERASERKQEREGRDIDRELMDRGLIDRVEFGEVAMAPPQIRAAKQKVARRYKLDEKRATLADSSGRFRDTARDQDEDALHPRSVVDTAEQRHRQSVEHSNATAAGQEALMRAKRKRVDMGLKQLTDLDADRSAAVNQYRRKKQQRLDLGEAKRVRESVRLGAPPQVLVNEAGDELGPSMW